MRHLLEERPHSCIQCVQCQKWTHFACANIDPKNAPYTWICRTCSGKNKPCSKTDSLNILQFNCNGLRSNVDECVDYMQKKSCKIGLFQETFLKPESNLEVPNYSIIRKDRIKDKGGGVAIFVHKDIVYEEVAIDPEDGHTEVVAIKIKLANGILVANVYIPPSSSCSNGFQPNLEPLLRPDSIICGDLNCHSSLWNSEIEEDRPLL